MAGLDPDVGAARSAGRLGRAAARVAHAFAAHTRAAGVAAVLAVFATAFVADEIATDVLPRAVASMGVNLSRSTPQQARDALAAAARLRLRQRLSLTMADCTAELTPADAGLSIDVERTVERAQRTRRSGFSLLRPVRWVVGFFAAPVAVSPVVRVVEPQRWSAALNAAAARCLTPAFAGALSHTAGRVTPVYPRPGQQLDAALAEQSVLRAVESGVSRVRLSPLRQEPPWGRVQIEQAVTLAASLAVGVRLYDRESERRLELSASEVAGLLRLAPSAIAPNDPEIRVDEQALQQWLSGPGRALERDAQSATFLIGEADKVYVLPSEPDVRVDTPALADAILAAARSAQGWGVLPLRRRGEPALSTEAALALGVRGLVSTFTTRHPCCERRVDNIHRIADLLDGVLVRPGESLSVNAVVGARTTSNGFVQAPAIEEGQMVESVGGGISQFATTLFNALFYGGYDIVERQPHTYWFPRYPMGHEATLSYPKPDLVFRNDTSAGLLIDTQYTGTQITVRLFGDNGGRKVRAEVSPRQNVVQPPAELVPSADLPPDEERVQEAGMVGWSVLVGRIISYADGTQKEERRKVTYRPRTRRVLVHPCRVPRGEKGHTGEPCPTPEESADASLSEDVAAPEGALQ